LTTKRSCASLSIPLRIFDRNQGEKLRTQLDVERNEKLMAATQAQVFSDVDSAYATVTSMVTLLQPLQGPVFAAGLEKCGTRLRFPTNTARHRSSIF